MFFVYILINKTSTRTYVGSTNDVARRLKEHNKGSVKSSKSYVPYNILNVEEFSTLREARVREKFYKTTSGRRIIAEMMKF